MNTKKITYITMSLALAASLALAIPAFAETNTPGNNSGDYNKPNTSWQGQQGQGRVNGLGGTNRGLGMMKPGVFGTVTVVNGNIITISGRQGFGTTTAAVTYTVDATNATVKKNNATSTVSSILVGDTVAVQGTVTGTNVTATSIFDGLKGPMMGRGQGQDGKGSDKNGKPWTASSTPPFVGNGQPIVAGTVSAINGTSLTVTTASNVTYTVDASNAKVLEGQNTIALSSVVVGNKIVVQGAVNGTSIAASTVIDQSLPAGGKTAPKGQARGFFGSIGAFFSHLFGF